MYYLSQFPPPPLPFPAPKPRPPRPRPFQQRARVPFDWLRACQTARWRPCHESQAVKLEGGLLSIEIERIVERLLAMFELCLLLGHSQRWNLTSLIFIPLDLAGLLPSVWMIAGPIKGILNPSQDS